MTAPKPGPRPRRPDVITIYRPAEQEANPRTGDDARRFRWVRRNASGDTVARSTGNYRHKAQAWRNIRRTQRDWSNCHIEDRTRTWEDSNGGTNLTREPGPVMPLERQLPGLREAARRL